MNKLKHLSTKYTLYIKLYLDLDPAMPQLIEEGLGRAHNSWIKLGIKKLENSVEYQQAHPTWADMGPDTKIGVRGWSGPVIKTTRGDQIFVS